MRITPPIFSISGHDLNSSDFDLQSDKSGRINGDNPQIDYHGTIAMFFESQDDEQFSVKVEWKDGDDNTVGTVDKNIDGDLQSTSPTGGSHYIFVTVSAPSDYYNVVATNETANQNRIDGSIKSY